MADKNDSMSLKVRACFFVLGAVLALLAGGAVRDGRFEISTGAAQKYLAAADRPVAFWLLVILLAVLGAGLIFLAFRRRKPKA